MTRLPPGPIVSLFKYKLFNRKDVYYSRDIASLTSCCIPNIDEESETLFSHLSSVQQALHKDQKIDKLQCLAEL